MTQNISQAIGGELNRQKKEEQNLSANLRVAVPGIIQAFDSVEQTVRVQPAIRELVTGSDYTPVSIPLPELLDGSHRAAQGRGLCDYLADSGRR